jgi:hypothetical protein
MEIPTISVTSVDPAYHGGEAFTINESDFDPAQHKRVDEAEKAEAAKPVSKAKK